MTYDQYDAFAIATDRHLPQDGERGREDRAVAFVNWYDAREFCRHLYSGTDEEDELKDFERYTEAAM